MSLLGNRRPIENDRAKQQGNGEAVSQSSAREMSASSFLKLGKGSFQVSGTILSWIAAWSLPKCQPEYSMNLAWETEGCPVCLEVGLGCGNWLPPHILPQEHFQPPDPFIHPNSTFEIIMITISWELHEEWSWSKTFVKKKFLDCLEARELRGNFPHLWEGSKLYPTLHLN